MKQTSIGKFAEKSTITAIVWDAKAKQIQAIVKSDETEKIIIPDEERYEIK